MPWRKRTLAASGTLTATHVHATIGSIVVPSGWTVAGAVLRSPSGTYLATAQISRVYGGVVLPVARMEVLGGQAITIPMPDWEEVELDWEFSIEVEDALGVYRGAVQSVAGLVRESQLPGVAAPISEFARVGAPYTMRLGDQTRSGVLTQAFEITNAGDGYTGRCSAEILRLLANDQGTVVLELDSKATLMGVAVTDPQARQIDRRRDFGPGGQTLFQANFAQGCKLAARIFPGTLGTVGQIVIKSASLAKRVPSTYRVKGRIRTIGGDYPKPLQLTIGDNRGSVRTVPLPAGVDIDQTVVQAGQVLTHRLDENALVTLSELDGSGLRLWIDSTALAAQGEGSTNEVFAAGAPFDACRLELAPSTVVDFRQAQWVQFTDGRISGITPGLTLEINRTKGADAAIGVWPSSIYSESYRYLEIEARADVPNQTLGVRTNSTRALATNLGKLFQVALGGKDEWVTRRIDLCTPLNREASALTRRQEARVAEGQPNAGAFQFRWFRPSDGASFSSTAVPWNASAAQAQAAIRGLGLASGYVTAVVTGGPLPGQPLVIETDNPVSPLSISPQPQGGTYAVTAKFIGDEQDSRFPLGNADRPLREGPNWGVNRIDNLDLTFDEGATFEIRAIRLVRDQAWISCLASENQPAAGVYRFLLGDTDGRRSLEIIGRSVGGGEPLARLSTLPAAIAGRLGWSVTLADGLSANWQHFDRLNHLGGGGFVEGSTGISWYVDRPVGGMMQAQALYSFVVAPPECGDVLFGATHGGPAVLRIHKLLRGAFTGLTLSPGGRVASGASVAALEANSGISAGEAISDSGGRFLTKAPFARHGVNHRILEAILEATDRHIRRVCPAVEVDALEVDLASGFRGYWIAISYPEAEVQIWRAFHGDMPLQRIDDLATAAGAVVGARSPALTYWRDNNLLSITYRKDSKWFRQTSWSHGSDWTEPVLISENDMQLREVYIARTGELATFRSDVDGRLKVDIRRELDMRLVGTFVISNDVVDEGAFGAAELLDVAAIDVTAAIDGQPVRFRSYSDGRSWLRIAQP